MKKYHDGRPSGDDMKTNHGANHVPNMEKSMGGKTKDDLKKGYCDYGKAEQPGGQPMPHLEG